MIALYLHLGGACHPHWVFLVSAPDHTQAKSGLATLAKFLGPDDVSFWNAGIPIKSVLAQLVTCESHDILCLVPKSDPGTRLSRKMEAKSRRHDKLLLQG